MLSIPDSPQLCECGCGQPAPMAAATNQHLGYVKGQPVRFIRGHAQRAAARRARPAPWVDTAGQICIPLPHGQHARVSPAHADLAALNWHQNSHGYVRRYVTTKPRHQAEYLHNVVLERTLGRPLASGCECDHIDGDKLNCTESNLREVTRQQNNQNKAPQRNNTTGIVGVTRTRFGTFEAGIRVNRRQIYLGTYPTLEEAAARRKQAEQEYPGHWRK